MTAPRIALVTGANRGIGLEIVRQLARAGLNPVLGARDNAKGDAAAAELAAQGIDVPVVALDVTRASSIAAAVAGIEHRLGPIDVLVNNAAILIDGPDGFAASLFDLETDTLRRTFESNLEGPLLMMKAVLPGMRARGYGRIVNVSSTAGQLSGMSGGFPSYRMSKAALNALTRIVAGELEQGHGGSGIKVNCMCPGWVRTGMGGANAPRSVEEGADTAVWLATLEDGGPTGGFFEDRKQIAW
ncbi:MAG: SDR family oxidoreductase [Hyphomicrobium sp.]